MLIGWTPDRIDQLKQLWEAGSTCNEIATTIGGVSRNAVIGKVHRLGLERRKTTPNLYRVKGNGPQKPARARKPSTSLAWGMFHKITPYRSSVERLAPRPDLICQPSRNLTLSELTLNDCRFAYGDGPFTFCGHPVTDESSYCGAHHQLCRQPVVSRSKIEREAA